MLDVQKALELTRVESKSGRWCFSDRFQDNLEIERYTSWEGDNLRILCHSRIEQLYVQSLGRKGELMRMKHCLLPRMEEITWNLILLGKDGRRLVYVVRIIRVRKHGQTGRKLQSRCLNGGISVSITVTIRSSRDSFFYFSSEWFIWEMPSLLFAYLPWDFGCWVLRPRDDDVEDDVGDIP